MSVVFSCPRCSSSIKTREEFIGRKTKCPHCGGPLVVPAPAVPVPEPEPDPLSFSDPEPPPLAEAPLFQDAGPAAAPAATPSISKSLLGDREPWYYRFLETYAKVAMIGGIILVALWAIAAALMGLPMLFTLANARGGGMDKAIAFVSLGVTVIVFLLFLAMMLLAILFQVALVLLAVDMGRNLRAIRKNTG